MSGTIRKRAWKTPTGEVKTAWFADYYDQNSRQQRKAFATKKAADDWLTGARYELQTGVHTPDADSITVEEACELWVRRGELEGLERGTLKTYRDCIRLHIVPLIGKRKLSRLTAPSVERDP